MTAHTCAGCLRCRKTSPWNITWSLHVVGVTL